MLLFCLQLRSKLVQDSELPCTDYQTTNYANTMIENDAWHDGQYMYILGSVMEVHRTYLFISTQA